MAYNEIKATVGTAKKISDALGIKIKENSATTAEQTEFIEACRKISYSLVNKAKNGFGMRFPLHSAYDEDDAVSVCCNTVWRRMQKWDPSRGSVVQFIAMVVTSNLINMNKPPLRHQGITVAFDEQIMMKTIIPNYDETEEPVALEAW